MGQAPVEPHPGRPGVRAQHPNLGRCRVEREPAGLQRHSVSATSAATARAARLAPARRPCRRAHSDVRISGTSPTRSPSSSAGSTTSNLRPDTDNTACTNSGPNLAKRPLCSTTTVVTCRSPSNPSSFVRCPFSPDPTSVTARSTQRSSVVAHVVTRATYRSRSWHCSARDTHPYTTLTPAHTATRVGR